MNATNIADLRRAAHKRWPAIVRSYIENGGYEQETLRRNRSDLEAIRLLPRVLNDVSHRTIATDLFGERLAMPVVLAPVGACGITYPNAEVLAARAAQRFGVPFCLSTLSIATIEDVAAAVHAGSANADDAQSVKKGLAQSKKAQFWFQLYMLKDKGITEAILIRARDAGCSTLVLSMDLHVRSQRHAEQRHGLGAPPRIDLPNVVDALTHPRWLLSMATSRRRTFGNFIGELPQAKSAAAMTKWLATQFDETLGVKDIEWARRLWPGKLLVKGVLHPRDARAAIDCGADGIVGSNHGGRQVDGAVSTVSMLQRLVDCVDGRGAVLIDGGVRSGIDVLKMLGLGADACLIGRAYLYGLGAHGPRGVDRALEIIRDELDENMALCGATDVGDLPDDLVVAPRFGDASDGTRARDGDAACRREDATLLSG